MSDTERVVRGKRSARYLLSIWLLWGMGACASGGAGAGESGQVAALPPVCPDSIQPDPAPTVETVGDAAISGPEIRNRSAIIAAMEREYPAILRDQGVSGTVRVAFLVGPDGTPIETLLDQGSGHTTLDQAALRVAQVYRFVPATRDGCAIAVWVRFPLSFRVRL